MCSVLDTRKRHYPLPHGVTLQFNCTFLQKVQNIIGKQADSDLKMQKVKKGLSVKLFLWNVNRYYLVCVWEEEFHGQTHLGNSKIRFNRLFYSRLSQNVCFYFTNLYTTVYNICHSKNFINAKSFSPHNNPSIKVFLLPLFYR